ncbi:MAG: efflux RND transporter periplasmic adaptor subunit, partial [Deltaproteobacteria bacterium]|nr:efflux RND transporter periplasmic adaptor subunit [Deltaproteobacteria bacterium]
EAYETDLPWIRYGQRVEFITQAVPGKSFQGIVSFINPFLDASTRTAKVRVNVENNEALLKPGMFVTAYVKSALNSKGEPISPDYTGKLLCPMHPEIVSNSPGNCPICEMTLVRPDSLPFIQASTTKDTLPPLLIPATAPLITGDRALVFVKDPGTTTFTLRRLRLGPRAESSYVVLEGLSEGEIVVTNGSFKIDADLQIRGRASMINSDPAQNKALHRH